MIITRQSITIKQVIGKDKYQEPLYSEGTPVSARVTNEINKVANQAGEEVVTNLTVLIRMRDLSAANISGVKYSDKFIFTDEFGNVTERVPQNIAPARGFSGQPAHVRVYV